MSAVRSTIQRMGTEIERKWLVDATPDGLGAPVRIRQGYLTASDHDPEIRVRDKAGRHLLTVKGSPAMSRDEIEFDIAPADFDDLWSMTEGARIVKDRHEVDLGGGLTAEVDVLPDGLVLVEVEFAHEDAALAFEPPAWFGEELTGRPEWSNRAIAARA